jgi:hypothetical protein
MQNIPISKTLFVITQLVWLEVSLVRSRRPTSVSPEPWPSGSTLSYPCPTYLSYLSYPISFPWNSIFGWRPLIRTRYTMWQSLVTKNRKSKKLFIKIWFFLHFFLTILPVRAFVRPRQKVSRGHFVSILCSTAFCALNHGLNFVGNSAYTFQRERLTHNLQKYFSLFDKKVVRNYFWIDFYLSYCLSPYLSN